MDIEKVIHDGLSDSGYGGGQFFWRLPGSSGAVSFIVISASCDADDGWLIKCEDGNGKAFEARGESHVEAMFWAAGIAAGIVDGVTRDAWDDGLRNVRLKT